jgi:transposase InsO family protein
MVMLFGVSRSAYYQWVRNGVSLRREVDDAELVRIIREIADRHCRRYGSPCIRIELREAYGKSVSGKKTARLMRENGLNARRKRVFIHTIDSKHSLPVCENILNRDFPAEKGGDKWVSDITYLRSADGWVFLTVVLDLCNRNVIGWVHNSSMEASETSVVAFEMAVSSWSPEEGLIFHSDCGSHSFRAVLLENCPSVQQSMNRKGNCWDNAYAESFFKTLKTDVEDLDGKHSEADVRQPVFYYIEAYYNCIRLHSAHDYVAPNVFYSNKFA